MGNLYKPTAPVSFLQRIELILKSAYKAEEQNELNEVNTDAEGVPFEMKRIIKAQEGMPYLLYRFDRKTDDSLFPVPYFRLKDEEGNRTGMAKTCDYVLFAEFGDENYIVLIELKKGKEDPTPQLTQMRYFVEFIQKRAHYAGIEIDNAKVRMVGITDGVAKERTKMSRNAISYENDFAQLYDGDYVWLKDLLK